MNIQFIATIYGEERSGIMKSLAHETHKLGGRWIDSRVSHLCGYFAGIIKIEVPEGNIETLKSTISNHDHITAHFFRCNDLKHEYQLWSLTFEAEDRSGLIDQISQALAEFSVDIDDMESHRYPVVELGQSVLKVSCTLRTPVAFVPDGLSLRLKEIDCNAIIEFAAIG